MSKPIRFAAFRPEDLNLNGDLGNLLVLKRRLELRGKDVLIESVYDTNFAGFDLLFVGHGSEAAWNYIQSLVPELFNALDGLPKTIFKLVIGSGVDQLLADRGVQVNLGERRSLFVEENGIFGYLNSEVLGSATFQNQGNSLLTRLHGPVLAKNPELVDSIIQRMGWADISIRNDELDRLDELAAASRKTAFEH